MAPSSRQLILIGLVLLGITVSSPGQGLGAPVTVVQADSVDWVGVTRVASSPVLAVQTGLQVSLVSCSGGQPKVTAEAVLPPGTCLWDFDPSITGGGAVLAVTGTEVVRVRFFSPPDGQQGLPERIAPGGDLFRGRLTGPPLKRSLAQASPDGGVTVVVPSMHHVELLQLDSKRKVVGSSTLELPATSDQTLGWGLGYQMASRLTMPWLSFAETNGEQGAEIISLRRRKITSRSVMGKVVSPWGLAPSLSNIRILEFDHLVPPLVTDWDRDGLSDLILTEPGSGSVFLYRGRGRGGDPGGKPDDVIKVAGYVLWRWILDYDGDGRDDLVLLTVSRLNIIDQLRVFRTGRLPARLSMRRQVEEGRFSRARDASIRISVPTVVSLTRNKRNVALRAPCSPIHTGGEFSFLVPDEDDWRIMRANDDGDWEVSGRVQLPVQDRQFIANPFDPGIEDLDGDGLADSFLLIRDPGASRDRVVLFLSG